MEKEKFVILIGPPGSGKGTQATLLSERLGLYLFETSKILEDWFAKSRDEDFVEADGQKFYAKAEKEMRSQGILCSPPFVTKLVHDKIEQLFNEGKGVITSGSPRTLYEGEKLVPFLEKLYGRENIWVCVLDQDVETSIFRNSHRRICELMRHSILHSEEFEKLEYCPIDGSKLVKRVGVGDDAEHIKVRFAQYKGRTEPIVGFFQKEGLKVKIFSGENTPAKLFDELLGFLS